MQQHDALVLPSIVEGRALVQQEFLSCGLPIIVTPNSGGEDLVEEGKPDTLFPSGRLKKSQKLLFQLWQIGKIEKRFKNCAKKSEGIPGKTMLKISLISTCLNLDKVLNLFNS